MPIIYLTLYGALCFWGAHCFWEFNSFIANIKAMNEPIYGRLAEVKENEKFNEEYVYFKHELDLEFQDFLNIYLEINREKIFEEFYDEEY